jgi:uncharacterized protein YcfJ
MKNILALIFLISSVPAFADGYYQTYQPPEQAVVIMTQPIIEQIVVRKSCQQVQQPQYYQRQNSSVSPVVGAIIGGVIGSRFGEGNGRNLATAAGAIEWAMITSDQGYRQEYQGYAQTQCYPITQSRVTGYRYIAEYNGMQFSGITFRPLRVGDHVYLNESQ